MKSAHCLLLAALLAGGGLTAKAVEKTVTVAYETGTVSHTSGSGNWKSLWTSTETEPQVTINTTVNNIKNGTSGPLLIYPGMADPFSIVIATTTDGWEITGYSFSVSGTEGKQLVHNGTTTEITSEPCLVEETGLKGQSHTLSYTGGNTEAAFADFTVTLKEFEPEDAPALAVDEMPADDSGCSFKVTNLVDGDFNDFTAWYHLQNGKEYLTGAAGGDNPFDDSHLYCFIKEGDTYSIYNKADGKTSLTYSDGKVTDGTTEFTVTLAQQFLPVSTAYGTVYRGDDPAGTNKWRDNWRSDYTPQVRFFAAKNNMTTTGSTTSFDNSGDFVLESGSNGVQGNFTWSFSASDNMYVYAYTFLAKKEAEFSEASALNGVNLTNYLTRIEGTNPEDLSATSLAQTAINGKGAIVTDCYVTIRRILTHCNTREPIAVFPKSAYNNQRRIPAITTVEAGARAGRLIAVYDNRPSNADIGAGNIGLEIAVSDDNGLTWSTPAYGKDSEGNDATSWNPDHTVSANLTMAMMQSDANTYWDCAFGDAAIVSDRETGRILMMAAAGPMNFFAGRRNVNPNQCARWYSEDGGETWTPAAQMTEQILSLFDGEPVYGGIDSQFIGSGRMMQSHHVKVGEYYRVYAVLSSQNNGNDTRNWVLYTDDFGQTWNVLGGTDRAAVPSNGDEPKAEELPDGSVLLAARGRGGNRNFNIFRYTDIAAGEGHWDNHINTNMGFGPINACDGEIMIIPAVSNATSEPCYLALQSFPYGGGRNYVTIAYKPLATAEDIATPSAFTAWEGSFRVSSMGSAYSTMAWQKDNTLGFFYEEQKTGTYDGMYINFTIEEITDGAYSYAPDTDGAKAQAMRDALVDLRAENYAAERYGYVGEVLDPAAFSAAVAAYKAAPSAENYIKVNIAEYLPEVEEIADGGVYHFISAHNGTYTGTANGVNFAEEVFLATDGGNLIATNDAETKERLFKVTRSENGNWHLFNAEAGVYAPVSPATSQKFTTSDDPVEYRIVSGLDGKTNLSCLNPTSSGYGSIHLDRSANIVAWTSDAGASQWYMELVEAPEMDGIECIERIETVAEETYFDLSGRPVARPARGLYITNRGRKVVIR